MALDFSIDTGLVVDSSFSSRQTLLRDLSENQIVKNAIEAPSLPEALNMLKERTLDACVLGPSLSIHSSVELVQKARTFDTTRTCAYVAVLKDANSNTLSALTQAGVHGVVAQPYNQGTFRDIVVNAVRRARKPTLYGDATGWKRMVSVHQPQETNFVPLAHYIDNTAALLHRVAQAIAQKQLVLEADGSPSELIRKALKSSLEELFPDQNALQVSGSFDQHFLHCALDWFHDRTHLSRKEATERLRQNLLQYHQH